MEQEIGVPITVHVFLVTAILETVTDSPTCATGAGRRNRSRGLVVGAAVTIGLFFDGHVIVVTVIALVWGFAVVADSAQFSTGVTELSEPEYMGTHLTAQTSMGFLLTLASIQLMPSMVEWVSWR